MAEFLPKLCMTPPRAIYLFAHWLMYSWAELIDSRKFVTKPNSYRSWNYEDFKDAKGELTNEPCEPSELGFEGLKIWKFVSRKVIKTRKFSDFFEFFEYRKNLRIPQKLVF